MIARRSLQQGAENCRPMAAIAMIADFKAASGIGLRTPSIDDTSGAAV
jgi:hypothetical protein